MYKNRRVYFFSLKLNQLSKIGVKNENFKMDKSQMFYISVLELPKCFEKNLYIVNVKH